MKKEVAKAIRKVLEKREAVSLLGVGTIMLDNLSAKIVRDGKAITPPKAKLSLYDTQTSNAALKKYLIKKKGLSKKQAEKAINTFAESIVNKLLNYGEAKIEGVTYLYQNQGGIVLKPIKAFISRYYDDLPVLPLKKVKKKKRPTTPSQITEPTVAGKGPMSSTVASGSGLQDKKPDNPVAKKTKPEPEKLEKQASLTSKNNETKLAPAKTLSSASNELKTPSAPILTKEPEVVIKPNAEATNAVPEKRPPIINETKPLPTKNIETSKATPSSIEMKKEPTPQHYPYTPPKDEGIGCRGPILSLLGLILLFFLLWKGCNYVYSKAGSSAAKSVDGEKTEVVNQLASEGTEDAASADGSVVTSVQPKECIIISGVFSDPINVRSMSRVITDRGLELYTESHKGLTRVGFKFDCDEEDLAPYLLDIRRKIHPKAWYLVPELYVEYE